MSDTNEIAEPRGRTRTSAKKTRRSYADAFRDLESRVRLATAVLQGATDNGSVQEMAIRQKVAVDILQGT